MPRFEKGRSGNPFGRPRRQIANLSFEARKWAGLALNTLVEVCQGKIKAVTPRDRLAAANALLDRGFGRPVQSVDMVLLSKRLTELSAEELAELNARLVEAERSQAEMEVVH